MQRRGAPPFENGAGQATRVGAGAGQLSGVLGEILDEGAEDRDHRPALGNRAWTFACKTEKQTPDGKPVWLRLAYAGETKIRRHVKIRKNANPFDPQWQNYFAERAFQKKFGVTRQQAGIKAS